MWGTFRKILSKKASDDDKIIDYEESPSIDELTDPQKSARTLTIKPDKESFECYKKAFQEVFSDINGITPREKLEIYNLILGSEEGLLADNSYLKIIYEKYFRGRSWVWGEYEKWSDRFFKIGRFPYNFPTRSAPDPIEVEEDLRRGLGGLTVIQLKNLLHSKGIELPEPPQKILKRDLIALAQGIDGIITEEQIMAEISERLKNKEFNIYQTLIRMVAFRGGALKTYNISKRVGVAEIEIFCTHTEDKEFVRMALEENHDSLPPFFPGDTSCLRPIINFEKLSRHQPRITKIHES